MCYGIEKQWNLILTLKMESLEANILLASEMIKWWFFCQCVLYWLAYRRRHHVQ